MLFTLAGLILAVCAAPSPAAPQVVKETVQVVQTQVIQPTAVPQKDRVQIYWYIGLGAGALPDQIKAEKSWIDKFNPSQTEIQLIPITVDNKYARDNLTAQIAAGNAPDIVGPVGAGGRAAVQTLNFRLENPDAARMTLTIHPTLVERESVTDAK